jgi:hypothetical protein
MQKTLLLSPLRELRLRLEGATLLCPGENSKRVSCTANFNLTVPTRKDTSGDAEHHWYRRPAGWRSDDCGSPLCQAWASDRTKAIGRLPSDEEVMNEKSSPRLTRRRAQNRTRLVAGRLASITVRAALCKSKPARFGGDPSPADSAV